METAENEDSKIMLTEVNLRNLNPMNLARIDGIVEEMISKLTSSTPYAL